MMIDAKEVLKFKKAATARHNSFELNFLEIVQKLPITRMRLRKLGRVKNEGPQFFIRV